MTDGRRSFPETAVLYRDLNRRFETAVRGRGATIEDASGNVYLDACGGALVVNLGHGRKELADAMARQARDLSYVHGSQFTTVALETFCEELTLALPVSLRELSHVYLVPGGTEATETAIKLARQYQLARGRAQKYRALGCRPSYHGNTLGALSVSGRDTLRAPYEPLLTNDVHAPAPFCYRCPLGKSYPECGVACADEVATIFERIDPGTVAAFFVEPVLGASAGAAVPPPEYLPKVREICDRYDVVLVVDEILTGFGRTGTFLALESSGVVPDVVLLSKGMCGGTVPGGAVVTKQEIVSAIRDAFSVFTHGFTFSHHAVVAAVGREVLRILSRDRLVERVRQLDPIFFAALDTLRRHSVVGDIRGRGLLAGVELVSDATTRTPFPREMRIAERIASRAFDNGLLVYPSTGHTDSGAGDMILLAPPFVVTEDEIDQIVVRLSKTLGEIDYTPAA